MPSRSYDWLERFLRVPALVERHAARDTLPFEEYTQRYPGHALREEIAAFINDGPLSNAEISRKLKAERDERSV